ncbi:MAG: hypothetical protein QM669_08575 [Siphonobacter sp.]
MKRNLKYYSKINFSDIILILVSLYWLWPKKFTNIPGIGLDWSWMLSLTYAFKNKFTFGTDWVFTYGPLGWLSTRAEYLLDKYVLFIVDLIIMSLIAVTLVEFLQAIKKQKNIYGILIFMYGVFFFNMIPDIMLQLLYLYLFFLFQFHKTKNYLNISIAFAISLAMFFIKLNYGFIGTGILFVYCFITLITSSDSRLKIRLCGGFLGYIACLFMVCATLNVNINGYVKYGLEIINAYNDGMNILNQFQINNTRRAIGPLVLAPLIVLPVWIVGLFFLRAYKNDWFTAFVWIIISIIFFLVYKHSFTYYSGAPSCEFFTSAPAWLGLMWLYSNDTLLKKRTIQILVVNLLVGPIAISPFWPQNPIVFPYGIGILTSDPEKDLYRAEQKKHYLPETDKATLSKGKVDVFPTNVDIVFYNQLTYKPRPVILGYKAYSEKLQKLNYDFYVSKDATDYVLYELTRLYHFHLDALSRLAMAQHYKIKKETFTAQNDTLLILEKQPTVKKYRNLAKQEAVAQVENWCYIPPEKTANLQWLTCKIDYSVWGKLRRFFFQPPRIDLEVKYADGTIEKRPAVPTTFTSGFPLQRINSKEEHYNWFQDGGIKNTRIIAFRFTAREPGFVSNYQYQIQNYALED